MENLTTWQGMDLLTLRIKGTAEYVTNALKNLNNTWVEAQFTSEEELRQEAEQQ